MSVLELGYLSFPILLIMIFLRAPIGLAMLVVGLGGLYYATGGTTVFLAKLKSEVYTTFSSYSLSIIPMFLLMGQFATLSGMSTALFKAAESWLGHRKGGVAMASVGACAGFGSICGSSLATAATMSRVALPELRRYGYSGGFSTATLAAGGTLGILIPPSVILVIYAILTEQNIAKLFLAAFIPGVLAAIGYMITISIYVRLYPDAAGTREPVPYSERIRALLDVWPVLLVFGLVVGGIYLGWFTPTEGAAVGAAGTGLIALVSGQLDWARFKESIISTAQATAMIFFIVLGAGFYNSFLALSQVPQELSNTIVGLGWSPWMVLIIILAFYLVFGCLMDSLSMILLTIPIFFPIISNLDFGLISLHALQEARFESWFAEAQMWFEGLQAGAIEGMRESRFARELEGANEQMAVLGLGTVADAASLAPMQIAAIFGETTPDVVQAARATLESGATLDDETMKAIGLRGANESNLARVSLEHVAIWFGILVLIVVEVGLITPPVGMNLFIINAMDRKTPMVETYKAVMWFVTSDIVRVAILVAFPVITLFLIPV
ncbi:TRAP transporter large permease [Vannielia litorea]|uniref:TRAP transporter large permease n=1 Tax=Vannielia litorea TaxID=1217970 RepID=UPI001C94E7C5|nr:TRAP transporter large permease [Vannielia litorea]MBY6049403.1 TRAP transporter large permease [Vannielia litorea]MBY6076817.1 TRAP transporter large permease [Vannielia litorea]